MHVQASLSWDERTLRIVLVVVVMQVMWTPDEDRTEVRQLAPGLIQTSLDKLSPQRLHQDGISRLLLRYNQASTQEIR